MAIENLFNDNKEPRAIYLSNQFHSFIQGDLTIYEYCQHLKTLADSLRNVRHVVSEPQLVLNMLRLNPCFSSVTDNIANDTLFPLFSKAHSTLVLKEPRLANESKVIKDTKLLVESSTSTCGTSGCRGSAPGSAAQQPGAPTGGSHGSCDPKCGDNGRRGHQNQTSCKQPLVPCAPGPQPAGPWVCFNP
ncbi:uncharacterized protein LOC133923020 [Phragmites australis]|uniref:uncharacterized protein LOC133923020 n=1 Tax=Phragmites australis TaxID=29695 RepID=UPI002D790B87|nr:uncharacterized protein LOC133923020 [Phragmites australis]